jgi:hypothetical protein
MGEGPQTPRGRFRDQLPPGIVQGHSCRRRGPSRRRLSALRGGWLPSLRHSEQFSPTIEHREAYTSHFGQYVPFRSPTGDLVRQLEATSTLIAFRSFVPPSIQVPSSSAPRSVRGPRAPLARSTRAIAAQHGSEDVDVRSRLRPDALPFRRFVFGHIVDSVHAFATPSRELRLA